MGHSSKTKSPRTHDYTDIFRCFCAQNKYLRWCRVLQKHPYFVSVGLMRSNATEFGGSMFLRKVCRLYTFWLRIANFVSGRSWISYNGSRGEHRRQGRGCMYCLAYVSRHRQSLVRRDIVCTYKSIRCRHQEDQHDILVTMSTSNIIWTVFCYFVYKFVYYTYFNVDRKLHADQVNFRKSKSLNQFLCSGLSALLSWPCFSWLSTWLNIVIFFTVFRSNDMSSQVSPLNLTSWKAEIRQFMAHTNFFIKSTESYFG
jgi:hypothetical protein